MHLVELWLELKRRNVGRVAVGYCAAAFVVLQLADITFPALGVPQWGMTFLLALAALGLIVAVVLSWIFDITPAGVQRTDSPPAHPRTHVVRRWAPVLAAVVLLLSVSGAYAVYQGFGRKSSSKLDDSLVVVVPFRVASPALSDLSSGLVELLATTLTGEGGLRAVDPGAVLSRVTAAPSGTPEQLAGIAREFGAGYTLSGSVISAGSSITITATMQDALRRRPVTERVSGRPEDLVKLVDELTGRMLAGHAGEEQLATVLTGTPLAAVRAYLDGLRAFRRSDFIGAIPFFSRALDIDSTFATAAMYLRFAGAWPASPDGEAIARGRRLAYAHQDRLGPADRLMLTAVVGPNYPGSSSTLESLQAWDRVVQQAPDRALAWFEYGDLLLHSGPLLELADYGTRAHQAFARAIELDSSFLAARTHMADVLVLEGRRDEARRLLMNLPAGQQLYSPNLHRLMLALLGDSAQIAWVNPLPPELTSDELSLIGIAPAFAAALPPFVPPAPRGWAEGAVAELARRATSDGDRAAAAWQRYNVLLTLGRPRAAAEVAQPLLPATPLPYEFVLDALYADGDATLGRAAVQRIEAARGTAEWDAASPARRDYAACTVAHWYVVHEQPAAAAHWTLPGDTGVRAAICKATTRVLAARRDPRPARPALAQLDSILRTGPAVSEIFANAANLVSANAHDALGETELAYRAVNRVHMGTGIQYLAVPRVRLQARLAAALGRRDAAAAAYRHYISMREQAEPALRVDVEAARAELAAMARERR